MNITLPDPDLDLNPGIDPDQITPNVTDFSPPCVSKVTGWPPPSVLPHPPPLPLGERVMMILILMKMIKIMMMMIKILMKMMLILPDEQHDQTDDVSVQEYNSPPSPGTLADITMQELGQHQPRDQPIHLHHPHHLHYLVDHNGHQIHNTWP